MVKFTRGNRSFSFPTEFVNFLKRSKKKIEKEDSQILCCIWGDWGCGKSILAQKIAYVLNPNITIDKILFDKKETIKGIRESSKEPLIADEGVSIFFGRGSMTKEGRIMSELLAQMRQKNLFFMILIRSPLHLDKQLYNSIHLGIEVFEDKTKIGKYVYTRKGNFSVYPNFTKGRKYYTNILQYYKLKKSNPLYKRRKPKPWLLCSGDKLIEGKKPFYAVNEEAYLKKKNSILDDYEEKSKIKALKDELNKKLDKQKLEIQKLKFDKQKNKSLKGFDFTEVDKFLKMGYGVLKVSAITDEPENKIKRRKYKLEHLGLITKRNSKPRYASK